QMVGSLVFKHGVEYLHQIRDWQAVQYERNAVELRVELLPGEDLGQAAAERLVLEKVGDLGLPAEGEGELPIVASLGPDAVRGECGRRVSLVDAPTQPAGQGRDRGGHGALSEGLA